MYHESLERFENISSTHRQLSPIRLTGKPTLSQFRCVKDSAFDNEIIGTSKSNPIALNHFNNINSSGRAGSYGIQAAGAMFVESIDGCFYNVVGLPAHQVAKRLWLRDTKPH